MVANASLQLLRKDVVLVGISLNHIDGRFLARQRAVERAVNTGNTDESANIHLLNISHVTRDLILCKIYGQHSTRSTSVRLLKLPSQLPPVVRDLTS